MQATSSVSKLKMREMDSAPPSTRALILSFPMSCANIRSTASSSGPTPGNHPPVARVGSELEVRHVPRGSEVARCCSAPPGCLSQASFRNSLALGGKPTPFRPNRKCLQTARKPSAPGFSSVCQMTTRKIAHALVVGCCRGTGRRPRGCRSGDPLSYGDPAKVH
jgi:hypothetical protein